MAIKPKLKTNPNPTPFLTAAPLSFVGGFAASDFDGVSPSAGGLSVPGAGAFGGGAAVWLPKRASGNKTWSTTKTHNGRCSLSLLLIGTVTTPVETLTWFEFGWPVKFSPQSPA